MSQCDDVPPRPPSSTRHEDDTVTDHTLPPPTGAGGVADPARGRQRRSSPLLSVLLASVGDHRGDDMNAQSILEDHLLRVWDETAAGGVDVVDAADSRRESREFFCQNG